MIVKLKTEVDSKILNELGYQLNIIEGGYISRDRATIIYLFRKPYNSEASQYKFGATDKHAQNIAELQELDYLVEATREVEHFEH